MLILWPGLISDAQRNLILQHANSSVFQQNYLSRYVTQDTQAIYRGLDPQTDVIRAASGMTRSIDPRCPRRLSKSQLDEVKQHPEVILLLRRRNNLWMRIRAEYGKIAHAKGTDEYYQYQEAYRRHRSKRKAVQKALMKQVQARYRKQQPVADIVNQLDGASGKAESHTEHAAVPIHLSKARRCAVAALFAFATSDPIEECKRRSRAIEAVTILSKRQERPIRQVGDVEQIYGRGVDVDLNEAIEPMDETKIASEPFPMECLPTQCIFCLGKTELAIERRVKAFHSAGDLKKHFHRAHLRHYPDAKPIDCPHPSCSESLTNKMHLQNHAARVLKTFT